jgi:hypothetical protein
LSSSGDPSGTSDEEQDTMEITGVRYQGFEIYPRTQQRVDTGHWITRTDILRTNTIRRYGASNTFATRDEAIARCIDFGRRIIDGEIPSLSALDLP